MGSHPVNLAFRFLLELAMLAALAMWGWHQGDGGWRFGLAVGAPLLAAGLWGSFRVPNDPGKAPIPVPGGVRLALELALFALAVWALADIQATRLAWGLGLAVVLHYLASYDRILWLVGK